MDTTEPYDFNTIATFDCLPGFDLEGDSVRKCISDGSGSTAGTWNNSSPSCSRKLITGLINLYIFQYACTSVALAYI